MNEKILKDRIDEFVEPQLEAGFSGCAIAVMKDGEFVADLAYGHKVGWDAHGRVKSDLYAGSSNLVDTSTLYDLASNTKMYSVNYSLQYMLSRSRDFGVSLDDKICDYFADFVDPSLQIYKSNTTDSQKAQIVEWKRQLSIRDILMHQAGFDRDPAYHNEHFCQDTQALCDVDCGGAGCERVCALDKSCNATQNVLFTQCRKTTLSKVLATPLTYEPGTKTQYSDVDYMLLGFLIEKMCGMRLDAFLKRTFFNPLGLLHITYNPLDNGFCADDCAATEIFGNTRADFEHGERVHFANVRHSLVQGAVHDAKAFHCMDGISGHAGLFASAHDLCILQNAMLGSEFFARDVVDEFVAAKSKDYPDWGLGWWRQGCRFDYVGERTDVGTTGRSVKLLRASTFGTHAGEWVVGHQGWTGTLTAIDIKNKLCIALLTNKKNSPVVDNTRDPNHFLCDDFALGKFADVMDVIFEECT